MAACITAIPPAPRDFKFKKFPMGIELRIKDEEEIDGFRALSCNGGAPVDRAARAAAH